GPRGNGSSRSRCPETPAEAGGRRRRSSGAAAGFRLPESRSSLEEGQPVLADLQLVAVVQLARLDAPAVEERPVQAALVFDEEGAVPLSHDGVAARDGDVVQEDVAVGRAADESLLALDVKRLTGAATARPHHESRPRDAEVVD